MASLLSKLNPIPAFPSYKGPYEVGTIDLEIPISDFVDAKLSPPCPPHSSIPTIQFRIFYPAALKGKAEGSQGGAKWVPSPRKEYVAAFCRFAGASEFMANLLSYIPRHLYYVSLPAYAGHTLLKSGPDNKAPPRFPVVIFSHGLGGTRNTYSYLTASLASQGAVVFSIEHRDGSGPTTFIREPKRSILGALTRQISPKIEADGLPPTPSSSESEGEEISNKKQLEKTGPEKTQETKHKNLERGDRTRIDYIVQPHEISAETAATRNKQLEIRLWELGLLYAAVKKLDQGWEEADIDEDINLQPSTKDRVNVTGLLQMFKSRLDIESAGSITWMGHSFGAATTTQFLKSVWYHPKLRSSEELKQPLYAPSENLLRHFHPSGNISPESKAPTAVLLDIWCLPLLGERTRALWKLPLPGPVIGISSLQFYKWKENLRGFRHVLNHKGGVFEKAWFADAYEEVDQQAVLPSDSEAIKDEVIPQVQKLHRSTSLDITPQLPKGISRDDEEKLDNTVEEEDEEALALRRSRSRASQHISGQPDRKFYYATQSAHFSQSDFGILFPRSARYFVKVDDSEGVLDLNVRAVTEFMREQGAKVAPFSEGKVSDLEIFGDDPVKGWELVSLELGEEGITKPKKEASGEKKDITDISHPDPKL